MLTVRRSLHGLAIIFIISRISRFLFSCFRLTNHLHHLLHFLAFVLAFISPLLAFTPTSLLHNLLHI